MRDVVHAKWVVACGVTLGAILACRASIEERAPTFDDDVQPILARRCASCHAGATPAGGWSVASYLQAIGCVASDGAPAAKVDDPPILRALDEPSHAGFATDAERATLTAWIAAGAPAFIGGVHAPSFVDPRSSESHGRFLRGRKWRPMLDATDPDACGVCHEGAPVRPTPAPLAAPGATPCTSCHAAPDGPLACATCHGDGASKAYPPRDRCFFPDDRAESTHAAHVEPSASTTLGVACTACHPTPKLGDFTGPHTDGSIEVWFDYARAGDDASYDPSTGACTTRCHAGPGAKRPQPTWGELPKMACGDCHSIPPEGHLAGACSNCHKEANATGTALVNPVLHVNGRVDLGDGSGTCGACHGHGDDPWPSTGAHAIHESSTGAAPVPCASCHVVPTSLVGHPLGTPSAAIQFSGLAATGGRAPTYDPVTKTCAGTYCHDLAGASDPAPSWNDGATASDCGACHSIPPPPPHTTDVANCGTTSCHGGSVQGLVFTPAGAARHVDGLIEL